MLLMIYHYYYMYFVLQYNYKCSIAESTDIALNAHLSGFDVNVDYKTRKKVSH